MDGLLGLSYNLYKITYSVDGLLGVSYNFYKITCSVDGLLIIVMALSIFDPHKV